MTDRNDTNDWPFSLNYGAEFPDGSYDETCHLYHIYPPDQARASQDPPAYFVGSAGADGIEFALRPHHSGVWAYHANESRWQHVAEDILDLDKGWRTGRISV